MKRSLLGGAGCKRRCLLWGSAFLLAALLVGGGRRFLGDVFLVQGNSMYPVLHGGQDRVLVAYLSNPLGQSQRFDLLVYAQVQLEHGVSWRESWRVKRLLGLPGEMIDFRAGDIYAGPERARLQRLKRPEELVQAMLVPVLGGPSSSSLGHLRVLQGAAKRLPRGGWALEGAGSHRMFLARLEDAGQSPDVRDGCLDEAGTFLPGVHVVPDLSIEFRPAALPRGARLEVRHALQDEWRAFRWSASGWRLLLGGGAVAGDKGPRLLAEGPPPPLGTTLCMQTLDGRFRLLFLGKGGTRRLLFEGPRDTAGLGTRSRVLLSAHGEGIVLPVFRVKRDVHYFWPPALKEAHGVLKGHLFLLGDNPRSSLDSRQAGDVPVGRVVGRVRAIVWPPLRWRAFPRPPSRRGR